MKRHPKKNTGEDKFCVVYDLLALLRGPALLSAFILRISSPPIGKISGAQ